jgi:hypothetical protein
MATKSSGMLTRVLRLGLAALVSAAICSTYFYFTQRDRLGIYVLQASAEHFLLFYW